MRILVAGGHRRDQPHDAAHRADLRGAGHRRHELLADDPRLPERRQQLPRLERQPRADSRPRGRRRAAHRLHAHRRRLGLSGRCGDHLGDPELFPSSASPSRSRSSRCSCSATCAASASPARSSWRRRTCTSWPSSAWSASASLGWRRDDARVHPAAGLAHRRGAVARRSAIFLILRAFSSGAAALTGVEAISDGVPAFKPPEWRNARVTLMWAAAIFATLFLGISFMASTIGIVPDPNEEVTVLAADRPDRRRRRRHSSWSSRWRRSSSWRWRRTRPSPTSRACRRSWPATTSCRASSPSAASGWPSPPASSRSPARGRAARRLRRRASAP